MTTYLIIRNSLICAFKYLHGTSLINLFFLDSLFIYALRSQTSYLILISHSMYFTLLILQLLSLLLPIKFIFITVKWVWIPHRIQMLISVFCNIHRVQGKNQPRELSAMKVCLSRISCWKYIQISFTPLLTDKFFILKLQKKRHVDITNWLHFFFIFICK